MSEIVAMAASFLTALYFAFVHDAYFDPLATHEELIIGIMVTSFCWILTAYISTPTDREVLISFVKKRILYTVFSK